ncbi:MAG: flippase [Desulfitobacteriaceae bacterium]
MKSILTLVIMKVVARRNNGGKVPIINKVARNLMSVGLSSVFAQFLTFLTIAYIARVVGKEGFGSINLAQAIITYFSIFTLFGLQTHGVREVSKGSASHSLILGEILTARLSLFVLSYAALFLLAAFLPKDFSFKILLILYGLTLLPTALNIDWFYSGIEEMQHNAVYNILRNAFPFFLLMALLHNEGQLNFVPLATFAGLVVATGYQYSILKEKGIRYKLGLPWTQVQKYLRVSFPFFLSGLLAMININIDRIVIGFSRTDSELGLYSAAYNIILFLTNVVAIIFVPVFPRLVKHHHDGDKEGLSRLTATVAKFISLFILPVAVGGIVLAEKIIILLYGQEYAPAAGPFTILLIFSVLLFTREIFGYQLNAWHLEKSYLKIIGLSSVLNLALNLILTPRYGIYFAASINIISETINLILMQIAATRVVQTAVLPHMLKAVLPSALMGGVLFLLRGHLPVLISIVLGILVYAAAAFFLRIVRIEEMKTFLS